MKTGYLTHPIYLRHDTGSGHPESPQRLSILDQEIIGRKNSDVILALQDQLEIITPASFENLYEWISEIHSSSYTYRLKEIVPKSGLIYLDPDTPLSPHSLAAAEMAVSAVLCAVDAVMNRSIQNAFCAIRPPGHHAEPGGAMGFCLFNNIAVAARYLQKQYGLERIFIVDWDVHHGNGTQDAFYDDPSVFYFSTHQYPCYPGTGSGEEKGRGEGLGYTLNLPLPAGSGDDTLLSIFKKDLSEAVSRFQPDFILISAGFDAHRDDPLASLELSTEGFEVMTQIVRVLAEKYCEGRIVSCLEGGYNLKALAASVEKHLRILAHSD